ncbi:hypothetical protein DL769_002758 [Monosporascus sp. CRB-8-3]|nr:hypothetical protein DL769_002758 [Monosporascus sp. CRB-8-3]
MSFCETPLTACRVSAQQEECEAMQLDADKKLLVRSRPSATDDCTKGPPKSELRQYAEREWDDMYPHIERLYITERRHLHEVVQHMRCYYGFSATARMYKIRLGKWGLFKNKCKKRTESETTNADTGGIDRQPVRLPDTTSCGGRRGRSRKRNRRREDPVRVGVSVPHRLPGTPAELRAYSIFDRLKAWAPREAGLEKLVHSLRAEDLAILPGTFASTEMYRSFGLARLLFARGQGRLAGKAIRRAFLLVEDAITSTDTMLMWNIVDTVYELVHWKQMSLLRLLLDYVEKMAASKVPDHPIRTVARALAGFDDELGDIAERAWKCNLDHIKWMCKAEEDKFKRLFDGAEAELEDLRRAGEGQQQPPRDGLVARGIWEFIRSSEWLGQYAKPEGITELVHSCQETRVWYISIAAFIILSTATRIMQQKGKCGCGGRTLRESYNFPSYLKDRLLQYPPPAMLSIYPKFYAQKAMFCALMNANELEKAEEPAKKILEMTDSVPDADCIRSILLRWSFEDLLEQAGKLEEARLIREDNVRRTEKFLANIPDRLP